MHSNPNAVIRGEHLQQLAIRLRHSRKIAVLYRAENKHELSIPLDGQVQIKRSSRSAVRGSVRPSVALDKYEEMMLPD